MLGRHESAIVWPCLWARPLLRLNTTMGTWRAFKLPDAWPMGQVNNFFVPQRDSAGL